MSILILTLQEMLLFLQIFICLFPITDFYLFIFNVYLHVDLEIPIVFIAVSFITMKILVNLPLAYLLLKFRCSCLKFIVFFFFCRNPWGGGGGAFLIS